MPSGDVSEAKTMKNPRKIYLFTLSVCLYIYIG